MESWAGLKNRVFPPSEGLKRIAVMRDFGYRGLMWDYLVRFPERKKGRRELVAADKKL